MKTYQTYGYWVAEGRGPLRPIIAEGSTRREAVAGWAECFHNQVKEKYGQAH